MSTPWAITEPARLDIGAGTANRLAGAVRLDRSRAARPHVVADLEHGLPFRTGAFEVVGAFDVAEHVGDLVALMEEIHRVLRAGGVAQITTPHFSSANAYTDPTHRRALSLRSFDCFDERHDLAYYSKARFRVRTARLRFKGRILGRLFFHLARRWPAWYEDRLAWIYPGWFLYFELEAVK
jgi:SAM-dependent methyltransferase